MTTGEVMEVQIRMVICGKKKLNWSSLELYLKGSIFSSRLGNCYWELMSFMRSLVLEYFIARLGGNRAKKGKRCGGVDGFLL